MDTLIHPLVRATKQGPEQAVSGEAPEILLAVALIGVLGIALGGVIQLITQRWAVRFDRMTAIRHEVAELAQAIAVYSSTLFQYSSVMTAATQDLALSRLSGKDDPFEVSEDYWNRLASGFFESFKDIQSRSIALQGCSDYRISQRATCTQSLLIRVHNKAAATFHSEMPLSADEARGYQQELNDEASLLLTMTSTRSWERYWRFRSARDAQVIVSREKETLKAAPDL